MNATFFIPYKFNYIKILILINLVLPILSCWFSLVINKVKAASPTEETVDYFNSSLGNTTLNKNLPIKFKANNISFNSKLNLIIASGNIEILQGNQIIKADKAYIQKDKNYILAQGNVYLKDNDNKEIFADKIEIKNTLNNAILENIKLLFPDDTLLSANSITKNSQVITTYNSAYTSCPFSKFFTPFWSIHAKKIVYNQRTNTLTLYNGWLQIKKVPILWLPYISYSEPNIKRRFGLLTPYLGNNSVLGYYYTQPIFIPINIHSDLNIKLTYFQNKVPFSKHSYNTITKPLFQTHYSSYIKNGEINFKGSYTPNKNNDWAIFTSFQKDLTDIFRLRFSFNDATSRNFLTLYNINNYSTKESFLWQIINLDSFLTPNDYLNINLNTTKNTNYSISRVNNPYILPQINFKHFGESYPYGKIDVNFQYNNFLTYNFLPNDKNKLDLGPDFNLQKSSVILKHSISQASSFGIFSLNSELQNVAYYRYYINDINNIYEKNTFDTYLGGGIALKSEYPIISNFNTFNSIVNPMVQFSYSNMIYNKKHDLSYLDPTILDISYLNLFEINKYRGVDYYSRGGKINYGLQWDLINNEGFSGQMLIGQSLDLNNNNKSNYLVYLGLQPFSYLKLSYTASLNNKLHQFEQNNFNIFLGNNLLGTYLSYRSINNLDPNIYNVTSLEELQPTIYVQLTPRLQLYASSTFNLKSAYINELKWLKNLESFNTLLIWQNSCFSCSIKISRTFYGNTEVKAHNSYQFAFTLKNLGNTGIKNIYSANLNPFQS